jgi:uncharacterized protein (TIGR03118 family)
MITKLSRFILATVLGASSMVLTVSTAKATVFSQTNLVSDVPGLAAITDPKLKNPWGVSFSPTSPFWISDQGTNTSTLYSVTGAGISKTALEVGIPTTPAGPQGPTGQVNNNTSSFLVNTAPASFIFANLNGTISAWNGSAGTAAQVKATTPGAVYTGLAIGSNAAGPLLYAANGAQNRIDVFNGSFAPVNLGANAFVNTDPRLAGLVPFNVARINDRVYVTYAAPGRAAQISAPEGSGAVAIFDTSGNLIRTLIAGGDLASPWGITLAPAGFGDFGGDLLVGNFSFAVSEINAFDPVTGAFLGVIGDSVGNPIINSGLWSITFGNGGNGGNPNTLYFTAGINGEANGLFGALAAVPEPATVLLLGAGLAGLLFARRRRRF